MWARYAARGRAVKGGREGVSVAMVTGPKQVKGWERGGWAASDNLRCALGPRKVPDKMTLASRR